MKKTENNWQLHAVRRAALLGAAMLTAMPLAAAAQVTIPGSALPGAVQPGRGDRPAPTPPSQPDFDFSIDAPSRSAIGRAVDTVTFTLKDLKITGAKTLPEESFRPLYAKLIGQTVKLNDILDVADGIEKVYRDKGYILVRAYVPPQRVRDGVFTINIVEGKIAHVTVQGGTPATQDQIRSYVAPAMDRAPLPLASMERSLLLSNDLPGTQATGVLKPSEDIPGASDLVVNVDQPRVTGGIGAQAATPPAAGTDGWGHALGSADCQLFDHLAQADQACAPDHPQALLALAAEGSGLPAPASAAVSRPDACARGPPVLA